MSVNCEIGIANSPLHNSEFIQIDFLIDRAYRLFSETSVFEVIDLPNRHEAIEVLREFYGSVDEEKVDRYLEILARLRKEMEQ